MSVHVILLGICTKYHFFTIARAIKLRLYKKDHAGLLGLTLNQGQVSLWKTTEERHRHRGEGQAKTEAGIGAKQPQAKDSRRGKEGPLLEPLEGPGPADTLILDFALLKLWENIPAVEATSLW